uniref:Uncharacterized protein n=1 Tax=Clytia hemisphaerica TaxID=252671 RepID=A0A7M5WT03_9CNID
MGKLTKQLKGKQRIARNSRGSSQYAPKKSSSWKDTYRQVTKKKLPSCRAQGCGNKNVVGAHMRVPGAKNDYLLPMCYSHNNSKGNIILNKGAVGVRATKSNTRVKSSGKVRKNRRH